MVNFSQIFSVIGRRTFDPPLSLFGCYSVHARALQILLCLLLVEDFPQSQSNPKREFAVVILLRVDSPDPRSTTRCTRSHPRATRSPR
jgi:hypothetical protein